MRYLPALLLLLACLVPVARAANPVASVPQLDISRYAGQWYEIAHLPTSFQAKCTSDITATYTLREDVQIGVRNACRTADGGIKAAEGLARPWRAHVLLKCFRA